MSALYQIPVTITRADFMSIGRRLQDTVGGLHGCVTVRVSKDSQSIDIFSECRKVYYSFNRYDFNGTIDEYGKAWSVLLAELEEYEQQYAEAAEAYNTELAF